MEKNNKFFNVLKILIYVVIAFILNQSVQYIFPQANYFPDFFLTLIWTFSYFFGGIWSLLLVTISGLVRDWIFSPIIGSSIFIGLVLALFSSNILQFIWQRKPVFFPIQVIILHFIGKLMEIIIYQLTYIFQYDIAIQLTVISTKFTENLIGSLLLNLLVSLVWLLILKYMIPFYKNEVDLNAENSTDLKEII